MIRIGITGGIGSGKSVVSRLMRLLDVPVYISDEESKRLVATDEAIRKELTSLLGPEVYVGGSLNKPFLAAYLFSDENHAARVNAIIHPKVKDDFRQWVKRHKDSPVVAMESAILIEAGFTDVVDRVVSVYAPKEVRLRRAMLRDGVSREAVESRMGHQMDDERKRDLADYVVTNDGESPLIPQVLSLLASLSENNAYLCRPESEH